MNDLITKKVTELPIGDSGFYFSENKIGNYSIEEINYIASSLYEIILRGMKTSHSDKISRTSETCWDMSILDLNDKEIYPGYAEKINESLYAIFDIESIEVGWPAHDVVIIKNIVTGKKFSIEFEAALSEEIQIDDDLYILSGSIFAEINNEWIEQKKWKVFIDQNGGIIYKGFCWEYQMFNNKIVIKKFKTSKKVIERTFN